MQTADLWNISHRSRRYLHKHHLFCSFRQHQCFSAVDCAGTSPKRVPPHSNLAWKDGEIIFGTGLLVRGESVTWWRQALMSDFTLKLQENITFPTMLFSVRRRRCVSEPSASPLNIDLMSPTVPLKVVTTGRGDFTTCARNFHHHSVRSSCWHGYLLIVVSTSTKKLQIQPILTQRTPRQMVLNTPGQILRLGWAECLTRWFQFNFHHHHAVFTMRRASFLTGLLQQMQEFAVKQIQQTRQCLFI